MELMTINGAEIAVERKKIKNMHLTVYPPDGRIRLSMPEERTDADARSYVVYKWNWIAAQRARIAAQARQGPREYVSGENHFLFGRRLRLVVVEDNGGGNGVFLRGDFIEMRVRSVTKAAGREALLWEWYRGLLSEKLRDFVEKWCGKLGEAPVSFHVQRMKTMWGSCNTEKRLLLFNSDLARVPEACIEYIVVHELTHLRVRAHNALFGRLMDERLPDWPDRKRRLNEFVALPIAPEPFPERNDFKTSNDGTKPREQMERDADAHGMRDEDLLAILLKTGARGCDVRELSRRLIRLYGSLQNLVSADWRSLEERIRRHNASYPAKPILGIGRVKCLELGAVFEIVHRAMRASKEEVTKSTIASAEDAYAAFRSVMDENEKRECFYVLPLNIKRQPVSEPVRVSVGGLASAPAAAREVFRDAIRWGAAAIIVAHNHPSGNPAPSEEDFVVTRTLKNAAKLLGISLLDHLVLGAPASAGGRGYVSIRECGVV